MSSYLIHQCFDKTAREMGAKKAVYCEDNSISYEELYISSNKMANCLKKKGVQRGDRVLVVLPKSINAVKSILGVLKADASYVPVDADAPVKRTIEIYLDCTPSAVICDDSTYESILYLLDAETTKPIIFLLSSNLNGKSRELELLCKQDIDAESSSEPVYSNIDQDIAYITYTSGSTGKPKGVIISHLNIKSYIGWALEYFRITENDNILNTSPFHFDMSVFDIYCSLVAGCSLTLAPKITQLFPVKLFDTFEQDRITIWKAAAFLLAYFVRSRVLKPERLPDLKKIIFSGENLPTKYLMEWMKTYPEKEYYNAYGPTEATGISTIYKVEEIPSNIHDPIPIGKPCANVEAIALKEDKEFAKVGDIGELYIRGSGLGFGYWNDHYKTLDAFTSPFNTFYEEKVYRTGDIVRLLPDGNFVFIGRKDEQIKYLGYRIELGEIEAALQAQEYVIDAAAIAFSINENELPEIIGYIELSNTLDLDIIWDFLKKRLPNYMIPKRIELIRRIPRTDNGKVDRQHLKKSYMASKEKREQKS